MKRNGLIDLEAVAAKSRELLGLAGVLTDLDDPEVVAARQALDAAEAALEQARKDHKRFQRDAEKLLATEREKLAATVEQVVKSGDAVRTSLARLAALRLTSEQEQKGLDAIGDGLEARALERAEVCDRARAELEAATLRGERRSVIKVRATCAVLLRELVPLVERAEASKALTFASTRSRRRPTGVLRLPGVLLDRAVARAWASFVKEHVAPGQIQAVQSAWRDLYSAEGVNVEVD